MDECEEKLRQYILANNINAEQLTFAKTCHSVAEAAVAAHALPEDFVKNICMVDSDGNLVVAIVKGEDRASTSRVAKALNIKTLSMATPEEIFAKTGYPCGGVPSFGYPAIFLIDPRVMEKEFVYTGGGSSYALTKISPKLLQAANNGMIVSIKK